MVIRLLALAVVAGVASAFAAGNVHASCGVPVGGEPSIGEQLSSAPVVFVGKVVYTSDRNRTARVKVESVWKGPSVPPYVDVHGEAPGSGPFSGSEGDHYYQAGQRYLFAPSNAHPPFVDYGECGSLTQPYSAELAAYEPPDARIPAPPTAIDLVETIIGEYWWPAGLLVLLIAAVGGIALRRRAQPSA